MEVEGQKRKEPEAVEAPEVAVEEPAAKKAKVEVDLAAVRKQIEYYFSDNNLSQDQFFHPLIAQNAEGWLDVKYLLSCKKVEQLKASAADILAALVESPLETKDGEDGQFVRRTAALPKLEPKAKNTAGKSNKKNVHEGGVIFSASNIPEDKHWGDVKDVIKVQLPEKSKIVFVSNIADKSCTLLLTPFENDQEFVENLKAEVAGTELKFEILYTDALKKALFNMPKHHVKKREHLAQERRRAKQKPLMIADCKFVNVNSLRGKIKEIISTRKNGQVLEPASADYNLVKAVLSYHPKGDEKIGGLKGLKVDESTHAGTRCFWMVKEDDSVEDISIRKCLDAIEANPPYAPEPEKKEANKEEPRAEEAKAEEPKAEEKKENAEAPVNAEAPKDEKPKVDETPVEEAKVAAA